MDRPVLEYIGIVYFGSFYVEECGIPIVPRGNMLSESLKKLYL